MWQVIKGGKVPTTVGIAKVPFTSSGRLVGRLGSVKFPKFCPLATAQMGRDVLYELDMYAHSFAA